MVEINQTFPILLLLLIHMAETTMKKILFISPQPFFQWRGSPIRTSFNVQALARQGYSVDLLTLPIGERREFEGVNVIRVANPLRVKQIPIGPSLHKIFFDILLLFKGLRLIHRQKYSVVHGVEEAGIIAVLLGRLAGCKAIFEKHSDPVSYREGIVKNFLLQIYAGVEKLTVRFADAVIGTGPGLVSQVRDMGTNTPVFHIFDIPSSLVEPEPENVAGIREQLKTNENEVLVTFVGSFAVYQGIDLLMDAIPLVVRECSQARFIIIGGTAREIEQRKNTLQAQGAGNFVTFLGKIAPDILPDYLAASDILLSPRTSGVNTPLKLLDYLKTGRPIVATDVQANRLILDENSAVFAGPEPHPLAAAIVSLVPDADKRNVLGGNGRKLHETKYNFQEFTKRLAACYKQVLGG
ncbi:MAG: glycosyltransferase family 4 protein [Desulfobulbaceae bacterium]|nr:glycosyltransferase family 4 protein [Desulfobulbaceae bacterium]